MTVGEAKAEVGPQPEGVDEASLWTAFRSQGSYRARERLFEMHVAFAKQIASQHFLDRARGDIELPDLRQLACAGLLEAIDRFDPGLGVPFRKYARRRISGSVLDGLAKMSEVREQISYRNRLRSERVRSLSTAKAEEAPLADAMQALVDLAVGLAMGFMLEGTGLYVTEEERDPQPDAYESVAWKEAVRKVMTEIDHLPERDQTILRRHYIDGLDFAQVAELLDLSKGRVSQLHKAAITLLRRRLQRASAFTLER